METTGWRENKRLRLERTLTKMADDLLTGDGAKSGL